MRRAPIRPRLSLRLPTGFISASCTIWQCPNTRSTWPNSSRIPARPSAMYRLADCYANLGQEEPALNTYRMLIDEVGTGEFVGSAAFRLGSREFDKKNFQDAAPLYEKAYVNAKSPEIKLTARYYQAKCLELIGKKADAAAAYEDVAKFSGKNPYRDAARLSLAYFALENNQKQQAFDLFNQLGTDAAKPAVKAEALTRAGILAADLKQKDKADQLFKSGHRVECRRQMETDCRVGRDESCNTKETNSRRFSIRTRKAPTPWETRRDPA